MKLTLPIGPSVSDGSGCPDDGSEVTVLLYPGDSVTLGRGSHANLGASDKK